MSANLIKSELRQRSIRKITGRIAVTAGTPSIVQGTGFTIADTAAGKVTVTLTKPGRVLLGAIATPINNTDATAYSVKIMGTPDATSVVFGVYEADATDGALVDNVGFFFELTIKDVSA
jgi:hypothetical protein